MQINTIFDKGSNKSNVTRYMQFTNCSIFNYTGIILSTIKENKKSAVVTFISSLLYGTLSYYEFLHITNISKDWNEYKRVFSLFASNAQHDNSSFIQPKGFGFEYETCLSVEGDLLKSLSKGRTAVAKHVAILFFKPLLLEACKHALTFSLRSSLIKKWLKNSNNQLGLKIIDNNTSMETREIIHDYSQNFITGVIGRTSSIIDVIIATGKIYDIYKIGYNLSFQGLNFNLLSFTVLAMGTFIVTNMLLTTISKKYAESSLKSQLSLKNNITFNMDNALQVECSKATNHEFFLLNKLLINATKSQALQAILNISVTTVSMIFTNFLNFTILSFSLPSIVKNPALYFPVQDVGALITDLCINLWDIFDKVSSSTTLHFSYAKIVRFTSLIDSYHNLLSSRKDFTLITNPNSNLSCNLTIRYPINTVDTLFSSKVLVDKFEKQFIEGEVYVISGPSGSGKTSFFNSLVGINPYTTGKITITNQENIVYVPQKPVFKTNLNWIETILYPLTEKYCSNIKLERKILDWIGILKLEEVYQKSKDLNSWVNNLSGGEAQRVSIIQALSKVFLCREKSNSKIVLLLDESLNALDPEMQEKAFNLIRTEVRKNKVTAIHIDHSDKRIIKERYKKEFIIDFGKSI